MQMNFVRPAVAALALGALVFATTPVMAETISYKADLKGSSSVPPNDSKGTGNLDAAYDTASKKMTYTITYTGLTGPATAAHFHGPAAAGANAPPVVPVTGSVASAIKGEATVTEAQLADLQAGRWYFNIHTDANKGGEIRGQVMKK